MKEFQIGDRVVYTGGDKRVTNNRNLGKRGVVTQIVIAGDVVKVAFDAHPDDLTGGQAPQIYAQNLTLDRVIIHEEVDFHDLIASDRASDGQ